MAAGGLTFGEAKASLSVVVENGTCADDPIVMTRTNEATQAILDEILPVNGAMTIDINAVGTTLLLPKELENIIEAEVLGNATVNGSSDIKRGYYNIVNQFTYLDPSAAHDNALVDQFLQPDPVDPTILRRQYDYPGLTPNATVRVTGAKRYVPIDNDEDYLIVQNVLALKEMIQSIERAENNDPQGAEIYHKRCIDRLAAEVKKHQLDPRNMMRRKGEYQKDLVAYEEHTFGWVRANLCLEVPALAMKGKMEASFLLNMAEKRLMQRGLWKDTIQEYSADVVAGEVAFPREVQSVLAVDLCGRPIPVRSVFFEYQENGPGMSACSAMLIDQGDEQFAEGRRRTYKLVSSDTAEKITAVCKLRWIEKQPDDLMTIKNLEALRLMIQAILHEEQGRYQEAAVSQQAAFGVLEAESREYLVGVRHVIHIQDYGFGLGSRCGGVM